MRTNVEQRALLGDREGRGIGWLPTYAARDRRAIVPIDLDLRFPVRHLADLSPGCHRIPRVRRMIDGSIDAFDPRKFPWFRDEFIHPNDLPKEYRGAPLVKCSKVFGAGNGPRRK